MNVIAEMMEVDESGDQHTKQVHQLKRELASLHEHLDELQAARKQLTNEAECLMQKSARDDAEFEMLWFRQVVLDSEAEVAERFTGLSEDALLDRHLQSISALEAFVISDEHRQRALSTLLQSLKLTEDGHRPATRRVKQLGNGVAHVNIWEEDRDAIVTRLDRAAETLLPTTVRRRGREIHVSREDGYHVKQLFETLFPPGTNA